MGQGEKKGGREQEVDRRGKGAGASAEVTGQWGLALPRLGLDWFQGHAEGRRGRRRGVQGIAGV